MFPQTILNSIPSNEEILFKSEKITNKRVANIVCLGTILLFEGFIAFIGIISDIFIKFDIISRLFTSILTIILLIIPFITGFFMSRVFLNKTYFLITNKKLYLQSKIVPILETVERINLTSIISYGINRRSLDNKNHGTLTIINDQEILRKIKNIPDFAYFQKIFESILYWYCEIDAKVDTLLKKLNIKIPITMKISQTKLNLIKKSMRNNIIMFVCSPILITIIVILINVIFTDNLIVIISIVYGVTLGSCFISIPLINIFLMKKRMSNTEQELIIEENKVYLKNNTDLPIQFNSNTSLHFLNTLKPGSYPREWNKKDTLRIRPFFDSKEGFMFGPIDNLPTIYEFFLFYLIKWKGDNANLFQESELDILKKELTLYSKQREISLETVSEKNSYLQNYETTDDIKKTTLNYLNPDEKISFVYRPTIYLYRNFIYLAVGIVVILIGLLYFNPFLGEFDFLSFIPFIFIMTLVPLFCCIQGVCSLSSKLLMRKSLYIFTNRKLIYKYGQKYCLINYENIHSVSYKKRLFTHTYQDIILNLKHPVENNPYLNKTIVYLARIPYNSNILKEIEKLRNEL